VAVAARTTVSARIAPFGLLRDERLARLAAAGHERAFAVVYERHHQALYRYCRSILRNDADAQDALQSTFTAAFAALRRGGPDAPIRPWLFRIAHNEAVSALRRRRPTVELSDATDSWTTSVDDQVADRGRLDLLLRDLRELHDRQRSALVMRELSGLSHEDIALALETSVGAAKQAIYEARRSLFEFAEGRAMSCDDIRRTISDADGRLLRSRRVRAHLRDCSACAEFAAAIPARRHELRALVPPLPAAAAAGLLGHAAGAGSAHGTGSGLTGLAIAGGSKSAGAALAANALAGVAVVASATVGVTFGVDRLAQSSSHVGTARHAIPAAPSVAAPRRTPTHGALPAARTVLPAARALSRHSVSAPLRARPSVPARSAMPHPAGVRTSRSATAAVHSTGSSSSRSSNPGPSGAAPGHTTKTSTNPGHSGPAPGHTTKTSTNPGHSGAAPGHLTKTATTPGRSAVAPGHTSTAGVVTVPSAVPLTPPAAGPPADVPAVGESTAHGHLK
jgi:RNA polymerase sigma factor (sigma-70 family)